MSKPAAEVVRLPDGRLFWLNPVDRDWSSCRVFDPRSGRWEEPRTVGFEAVRRARSLDPVEVAELAALGVLKS